MSGSRVVYRDTTPAPRWGPTPMYGTCEAQACASNARRTCEGCGGEFCLTHVPHEVHDASAADSTTQA